MTRNALREQKKEYNERKKVKTFCDGFYDDAKMQQKGLKIKQ